MAKRQVEVFTAGCPVCEPAVRLIQEMACPDCEITIHDLRRWEEWAFVDRVSPTTAEKAAEHGITAVPAVVVDGSLVSSCQNREPDREELAAAGIGQRL